MGTSLFHLGVAKFGINFKTNMKLQKVIMNSKQKSEVGNGQDLTAEFVFS